MAVENRVIVLIDMDCFYCQVEEKMDPELKGQPIAVVQYNPWMGGGIIAVNYIARAMGVKRGMRGNQAKEKCPDIKLPSVPCLRGKADISKYREAGKDVARVLQKFTLLLERASIDEAYLDVTALVQQRLKTLNINTVTNELLPNTYALGYESVDEFITDVHSYGCESMDFDYEHNQQLLIGAVIVSEIRAAVYEETGYRCSAGIAHNKILAKLVCGMNKPNKQTILPKHSINTLYRTLSIKKVKNLGGKFGDTVCEVLRINNMSQLQVFPEKELQARFDEKNGTWLYNIARGIDLEPVEARFNPKSIGCCKNFKGKNALISLDSMKKWLVDLGKEIDDRLEKDGLENSRTPKQMVVSFSTGLPNGGDVSSSRSYNFMADDDLCAEFFTKKALELVMETTEGVKIKDEEDDRRLKAPIKFLGISVGKFENNAESKKVKKIVDYFAAGPSNEATNIPKENVKPHDKNNEGKEYILQKFFQPSNNVTNEPSNAKNGNNKDVVLESALDKQESFFAKFLNKTTVKLPTEPVTSGIDETHVTPICGVLNCGENSNDSEYSTSTINNEINRSIALFEEDSHDVNRVSNMRQLLNSTIITDTETTENEPQTRHNNLIELPKSKHSDNYENFIQNNDTNRDPSPQIDTIQCSECGKTVNIDQLDMHADYHLALRLRDEERQQARLVRKEKSDQKTLENDEKINRKKPAVEISTNKHEITSVASFLVKIDDAVPTEICLQCGKKVPTGKLPEHLDFHEAQKLSRELNKKPVPNGAIGNTTKRKRKSASPVKKPKVPCKSIASFFNR